MSEGTDDLAAVLAGAVRKGYVRIVNPEEKDPKKIKYQLTDLGRRYVERGFPKEGYA